MHMLLSTAAWEVVDSSHFIDLVRSLVRVLETSISTLFFSNVNPWCRGSKTIHIDQKHDLSNSHTE